MEKITAKMNRLGHIEVYYGRIYDGEFITTCPLYIQAEYDIQAFIDCLPKKQAEELDKGYTINVTDNVIVHEMIEISIQ